MNENEMKKLTNEDIAFILDEDVKEININSMDELVENIRNSPNSRQKLRKFVPISKNLEKIEDRIKYLRENYYIGEIGEVNKGKSDNSEKAEEFEEIEYANDFDKIVTEMESDGFKSIVLESEDVFSSVEIKLVETNVIENGSLKFTWRGEEPLDFSKILLMEKNGNKVLALGHVLKTDIDKKYWAVFDDSSMILYERFENQTQVRLVVFTKEGKTHSCISEMNYIKMATEKEKPLCIDFGTSNTTVGTYGIKTNNDIEAVKFVDVTVEPHNTNASMLPTVIFVEDCSDENDIKYVFGYEALKRIEQTEHYEFKASAFFEIKRWMTSPSLCEEIRDNNNNKLKIERKKIIKAYIDYVIEKSEQYFGVRFEKIHFSAPVKLKSLFISTFKELYSGEKIILDESESIDEAFAIVYNQIINIIDAEKKTIENKNILIMDCGGGTTDLANCSFTYKKNDKYTDELTYTTRFENGNSNFGGNNITYRVMQLLKIKIASDFDSSIIKDAMVLINQTEDMILNSIEKSSKIEAYNSDETNNDIYQRFVEEYNKCEDIIPTKFSKDLELDSYELKCRKRNFYCMWRLAEKIKIEFFNSIKVQFDFCNQEIKQLLVDSSNDYFYVCIDGNLIKVMNPLKNVTITNKDVERIICGDIYGLLYGLMKNGDLSDGKDNNRKVENFDYYKLSGQSCKIPMFKELLKEYIPGRKLRPYANKSNVNNNNSEPLKLECLQGCIRYIKDQRGHELNIIPSVEKPKIIYNLFIKNTHAEDEKIFDCTNLESEKTIFKIFNYNSSEMVFDVRNKDGAIEKEISINLEDYFEMAYDNIDKILENILETYSYKREDMKVVFSKMCEKVEDNSGISKILFCVPSPDCYGVSIFIIQHEEENGNNQYKLLNCIDVSFENADKTFFDGKR